MNSIQWNKASILLGVLAVSASLFSLTAFSQVSPGPTFSAAAITGKVVDAETGQPLAGVNIVAQWKIDRYFVGDDHALLKVLEAVSDKDGNYGFPAWGPILLRPMSLFGNGENPRISYFKSGYWPAYEHNEIWDDDDIANRKPPLGEFVGNGKTIKLRKWDGKDKNYWTRIQSLASDMPAYYGADWKNYPHMTWAIEIENRRYMASGKYFFGIHVDGFRFENLSEEDREYLRRLGE